MESKKEYCNSSRVKSKNFLAEVVQTDVLIIGGGAAGARAAVEACNNNVKVTMVMKARFGEGGASGWNKWGGGINVPNGDTDPADNPQEWMNDILRIGRGMCDEKLVRILTYETIDRINELESLGLNILPKYNGKYSQIRACYSTYPRLIPSGISPIAPSIVALLKQQVGKKGIMVLDDVMITKLLMRHETCIGALGVSKNGKFWVFKSKSTILATGGASAVFSRFDYPHDASGDGYALGFHAGAELYNMEFIQIIPGIHVVLLLLRPDVYNRLGERFLPKYLPKGVTLEECFQQRANHMQFTSADIGKYLDIAFHKEVIAGRGTENMGIYIDFTGLSEDDLKRSIEETRSKAFGGVENTLNRLHKNGINILSKPLEAIACTHAFNGGFRINERTETSLPGLYAIGETATGTHGADRLGGNMIPGCLVFGARAGKFAAERALNLEDVKLDEDQINQEFSRLSKIFSRQSGTRHQEIRHKIGQTMSWNCLTVRNQKGLESCIEELKRIRNEDLPKLSVKNESNIFRVLEIPNLIDTGEILAFAALQRKESRGSHYRDDYPDRDDKNWMKPININKAKFQL